MDAHASATGETAEHSGRRLRGDLVSGRRRAGAFPGLRTERSRVDDAPGKERTATLAEQAMSWAVAHLSEREAVFSRADVLAAALAWKPGAVLIGEAECDRERTRKIRRPARRELPGPGRITHHRQGHRR